MIGDRRAALVYSPGFSHQVDWLAAVAAENEVLVYIDDSNPRHEMSDHSIAPEAITESVPVSGGTHYVGLAMSRLLTVDGKLPDRAKPPGTLIVPRSSAENGTLDSLTRLFSGSNDTAATAPAAITVRSGERAAGLPQVRENQVKKLPIPDEILIERIMADIDED